VFEFWFYNHPFLCRVLYMKLSMRFPRVKRPGCEADHSPSSSAKIKEGVELYLHSSIRFMALYSVTKNKHRDNFIFTFGYTLIS